MSFPNLLKIGVHYHILIIFNLFHLVCGYILKLLIDVGWTHLQCLFNAANLRSLILRSTGLILFFLFSKSYISYRARSVGFWANIYCRILMIYAKWIMMFSRFNECKIEQSVQVLLELSCSIFYWQIFLQIVFVRHPDIFEAYFMIYSSRVSRSLDTNMHARYAHSEIVDRPE